MGIPVSAHRGLPPPTRGIPGVAGVKKTPLRSTPAHAGNTNPKSSEHKIGWVYPRPRGEYTPETLGAFMAQGLPPPTRGILWLHLQQNPDTRSTPAHAGNTLCKLPKTNGDKVYPRPRGEYIQLLSCSRCSQGLPPPTRGIRCAGGAGVALVVVLGSTPAHAGNTAAHRSSTSMSKVYPRPRGEYRRALTMNPPYNGLPPPTRGIQNVPRSSLPPDGSTPAHAGNTTAQPHPARTTSVYPRPRGEYPLVAVQ